MTGTTPWLSVVMPVHNGAATLAATLDSVAAQDTDGIEFLLLDSSDGNDCCAIAAHYADRLSINWLDRRSIKPWPAKTDAGVALARAPHVAMLHQDDLWLPGHVTEVRRRLTAQDEAVFHIAPTRFADVAGREAGLWSLPLREGLHDGAIVAEKLLVQNFVAVTAPVVRRDAWLAVGGMDYRLWYTADWDLYLKLAASGSVAVWGRATTAFRIHGQSLTMTGSRNAAAMREQHELVLARHGHVGGAATLHRARASAAINCALARIAAGQQGLPDILSALVSLGPLGALRYTRESRIIDRILPRLRARFSGGL